MSARYDWAGILVEDNVKDLLDDDDKKNLKCFQDLLLANEFFDFIRVYESRKQFKPKFSEDDTAFGRLLFSAIGLFSEINFELLCDECSKGLLFVYSIPNNNENHNGHSIFNSFYIRSRENLLISLFDVFYNYYNCIENNADINGEVFVGFISAIANVEPLIFKIEKSFKNKGNNKLIPNGDSFNEKASYYWEHIRQNIVNDLYIDVPFFNNHIDYFNKVKYASDKIQSQIFEKYILFKNGKLIKPQKSLLTFPLIDSIKQYIESYYNLALLCIKANDMFSQSEKARDIINDILNFGVANYEKNSTKKESINYFWLLSPFALNSLRNVYERTIFFVDEMKKNYKGHTQEIRAMLESDFVSSCVVDFRRWTYTEGKNSLITFEGQENFLFKYKYENLSSIKMVRAIRLYEKIKQYINLHEKKNNIEICLVGYSRKEERDNIVEFPEIAELDALVSETFKNYKNLNVSYTVIQNSNKFGYDVFDKRKIKLTKINGVEKPSIKYYAIKYKYLFNRQNMFRLLDSFDLIFFLDCPDLYYEEFYHTHKKSWDSAYRLLASTSYNSDYNNAKIKTHMASDSVLSDISSQLSILSNKYSFTSGTYRPMLKEYLLDYMQSFINLHKLGKMIYCYLSTLESPSGSSYTNKKITHIERYNNKTFYIVNIREDKAYASTNYGQNVKLKDLLDIKDISEVFSFWNILKNVSIRLKDSVFSLKDEDDNAIDCTPYLLDQIIMKFSWDAKMENYCIKYGFPSKYLRSDKFSEKQKKNMQKILENLKDVIENIFNLVLGIEKNMLGDSIRDAVCNVLLGRADNSVHLLNYYRIKKGDLRANPIKCQQIKDDNEIEELMEKNQISSMPDKKLYLDAMERLTHHSDSISKSEIELLIQENNSNPKNILNNIAYVCKICAYTQSNLYQNIKEGGL